MSESIPASLERLMEEFARLPGIGPRSAERLAFHILKSDKKTALSLAAAIRDVKEMVRHCRICYNLTEKDPCLICTDPRRDTSQVFVVEQPKDLLLLEATGLIRGVYHVLLGHIAPLDGVEPDDLTIAALIERVKQGGVREVIISTNPTMEGEGTALHIKSLLQDIEGVSVTRLARGLPSGSQIEYATRAVLQDAIEGRREY
ncbi:MAG TPA: recombination mediator RecR [Phycisphaerae bacterium]|nr:recombination mediator RecR [Phycisphaerae bacterium]HRW51712.1 recombination mediator RecR [Phycisphaerae bacterium]